MIRKVIKTISKKEWKLIWWMIIFIILITSLPYIYGWYMTPQNHIYTGLHSLTPGDMHVYFSWMEQVKQGHFISEDLYTSEPQARIIFNSFWSFAGLFSLLTGLSNNLTFQFLRVLFIVPFVILLYFLAAYFWKNILWRKINFIFLLFASGLGVFVSGTNIDKGSYRGWYNWPLDLWAPENSNLLTMFQSPHLIAATGLLTSILFLGYLSITYNSYKYSTIAGVLSLALIQFHPFHTPTIFGVLGVYFIVFILKYIFRQREKLKYFLRHIRHLFIIGFLSFPSILYWMLLSNYDYVTQIRTYQNICLTPSWPIAFLSYGFLIILPIIAIGYLVYKKKISNLQLFMVIWLAVQLILLFSPFRFQRRIMQGLQIPMIMLSVLALYYIYQYLKNKLDKKRFNFLVNNKYLLIILFILFFTTSHFYNWTREIAVFAESYPQLYLSQDRVAAYQWLKENTTSDEIILSDQYNGNLIPGKIGRRVYMGHGVETLHFQSKFVQTVWFFATNKFDKKKRDFLKRENIGYIFYSNNERGIGSFTPENKDYLRQTFVNNRVKIYEVIRSKL